MRLLCILSVLCVTHSCYLCALRALCVDRPCQARLSRNSTRNTRQTESDIDRSMQPLPVRCGLVPVRCKLKTATLLSSMIYRISGPSDGHQDAGESCLRGDL